MKCSNRQDWMSDNQWNCALLVARLFGGFNHVLTKIKPCGIDGISVTDFRDLATYDFHLLTELVFLAHDMCIRVSVSPGPSGKYKLMLWQRQREGAIGKRHPTIEEALATYREKHPEGWEEEYKNAEH